MTLSCLSFGLEVLNWLLSQKAVIVIVLLFFLNRSVR